MGLSAGTKLGPYEVQSVVGAGGMGEVYRARDTRLQRDVAIKVLPAALARDDERVRRFEQEAKAVAALNHPNLLTVFDVGTLPDPTGGSGASSPFIVSELLEGATLRARLAEGAIGRRKALDYAVQIANGLAAAHERGIVHRDIKPENIFITQDDRVKILDFGLAKLTQPEFDSRTSVPTATSATEMGLVLGTVGYMSPEQLRGKKIDARSDIFSFGAVLYEMLSHRRAFHGESSADITSAILHQQPPDLASEEQAISPALDHIVHHCLEKDPLLRFQSARDLAFQLNELRETRSSSALRTVVDDAAPARLRRLFFAAIGTIGLLAAVAATWFIARSTFHQTPAKFSQLTFQQGFVQTARLLPDGKSFVCACRWGSDREMYLYTGSTDSQNMRSMGIRADALASISASGELLVIQNIHGVGPGYVAVGALARMPMSGGAPRPLQDNVQYADWAPGGNDFLVVRFVLEKHEYRLEYPSGKVLYSTSGWISDPHFSRDGKRIAFLDHPLFGDDMGNVAVIDLDGRVTKVSGSYGSTQNLAWSPDGREIWFSAAETGVHRSLYATNVDGRVRPLLFMPGHVDIQDARADGEVLLNVTGDRRVLEIFTPDHPEGQDFTWMDWAYAMRFSLDGKFILFGDQHSGDQYGTFLRNVDGSPAVRLGDGDPMDLSADGKWAISRLTSQPSQLLLLPTGTGEPRQLTHSKISHLYARWLRDGRIVASGNEPERPERSFLLDIDGKETPLTPEGIVAITASNDMKTLVTIDLSNDTFALSPFADSERHPLTQFDKGEIPFDFTLDDKALLFRKLGPNGSQEIWRMELASGKKTLLHTVQLPGVPAISNGLSVTASRDGKSYAYQYHPAISTEYLVEGLR
jgi:eukaryotic-like serine/threonine-protein kinase